MDAKADIREKREGAGGSGGGNEGQKMVWHLQDMQSHIDAEQIEAPQLLPGISLSIDVEERKKNRRLYKPDELASKFMDEENEEGAGLDTKRAFNAHADKAKEILFRERGVDNLMDLIYGKHDEDEDEYGDEEDSTIDTYRYDVAVDKLAMYKNASVKRKLKSKFVTG